MIVVPFECTSQYFKFGCRRYLKVSCLFHADLNEEQEMIINEEFKSWKKNSPYLYDLVISHALEWPSITFQWSPVAPTLFDDYSLHTCLISANASEKEQSYLLQATVKVPAEKEAERTTRSNRKVDKDEQPDSILKSNAPKFEITTRLPHPGEINRARYNPFVANLIATKAISGEVLLFDTSAHPTEGAIKPIARLVGHSSEGYGLAWNPREKNQLLSSANDKRILMWDISASMTENQRIEPAGSFDFHTAFVEDVAWHQQHRNIFASCSDDRIIAVWDTRFRHCEGRKPIFSVVSHTSEIYSLDFNPFNDYLFLSGSEDKSVALWDLRKLNHSLLSFYGHNDSVSVDLA